MWLVKTVAVSFWTLQVNNLALQSLVAAYAAKKAIVESSARAAVTEVTAE